MESILHSTKLVTYITDLWLLGSASFSLADQQF